MVLEISGTSIHTGKSGAARNKEQKADVEDIKLFINSIRDKSGKDFSDFVEQFLDKEKFFTFIAMDRAFGSHHHDYAHNHKVYFDPYKGTFEPLAWDLRFWLPIEEKDLSLYPLQLKLASNPQYDADIDKITWDIINDNLVKKANRSYGTILASIRRDLESDVYRDSAFTPDHTFPGPISKMQRVEDVMNNHKASISALTQPSPIPEKIVWRYKACSLHLQ